MRRWLPGGVALAASLVALRAASGCSGEGGAQPVVDSGPELSVPDAARPRDAGPDARDAAPTPGELEGWVRWDDYDPKCNFSIPSERKYLPEPFEWEPCQDTDVTRKLACRRIKKKWEGNGREFISPATKLFHGRDGAMLIGTAQLRGRQAIHLIGQVDGANLTAVAGSVDGPCIITGRSAGGERFTFAVSEGKGDNDLINPPAAIGGDLGSLKPRLLVKKPPTASIFLDTFAAGNLGFIMNGPGPLEVYSWDTPPTLQRSLSGHGRYSFVEVRDDFFFYSADRLSATERIWTPEGGDQLFVGNDADTTRGTFDINTDGVDWVWAEGEGRTTTHVPRREGRHLALHPRPVQDPKTRSSFRPRRRNGRRIPIRRRPRTCGALWPAPERRPRRDDREARRRRGLVLAWTKQRPRHLPTRSRLHTRRGLSSRPRRARDQRLPRPPRLPQRLRAPPRELTMRPAHLGPLAASLVALRAASGCSGGGGAQPAIRATQGDLPIRHGPTRGAGPGRRELERSPRRLSLRRREHNVVKVQDRELAALELDGQRTVYRDDERPSPMSPGHGQEAAVGEPEAEKHGVLSDQASLERTFLHSGHKHLKKPFDLFRGEVGRFGKDVGRGHEPMRHTDDEVEHVAVPRGERRSLPALGVPGRDLPRQVQEQDVRIEEDARLVLAYPSLELLGPHALSCLRMLSARPVTGSTSMTRSTRSGGGGFIQIPSNAC